MANTAATRAAANRATARMMAAIVLAGGTAETALAAARPLNEMIRESEERARRYQERKRQARAEALASILEGGAAASDAELHALAEARSTGEYRALVRQWEEWEREAMACPLDLWDGSNDYCAA